jgi:eukaryotic translation initiation factor 2C
MITVAGHYLQNPGISYGKKKVNPRFGSWNMAEVQFSRGTTLKSWAYLVIADAHDNRPSFPNPKSFTDVMDGFVATLRKSGVQLAGPINGSHIVVQTHTMESQVDQAFQNFAASKARPDLVFVIVPSKLKTPVYNRVKINADVKHGFHCVCALDDKLAKSGAQYHANVALKFNLKLGGINHTLEPAKLGIIKDGRTMVVGIDVTHPNPGAEKNAPSVAAIVSSTDKELAQFPADLRIQPPRQEMVDSLGDMFKSRLRLWAKKNSGAFPENIIVYRDGVSEGQYSIVIDKELPALRGACRELYAANASPPKITVIIVSKRHHTRFYVTNTNDMDRSGNPNAGLVVDRSVTEARSWDFFMQAHTALQGTARPTYYYVIHDEVFRNNPKALGAFQNAADALQDLTLNMCYLYGRATKAVRVTPPVYYADLVCDRARKYLNHLYDPSPDPTPAGSVAATSAAGEGNRVPNENDVTIHPNVRDSMFYI